MKNKVSLEYAEATANIIIDYLKPYCERIEIAGSIRRRKPEVGDIEICAIPKMVEVKDMFDIPVSKRSLLDDVDYSRIGILLSNGSKYKKIQLPSADITLDLFIVIYPAQWGVIFMIRTGSAEFSKMMVTRKCHGGRLPSIYIVKGGAVWKNSNGTIVYMNEEKDYFNLCDMEVPDPQTREV